MPNLDHLDVKADQNDLDHCDHCHEKLAVARKAEYPGGYPWEYFFCVNPDCPLYRREQ